jgi:DNA (cytosine-5)-methyltransferase 1
MNHWERAVETHSTNFPKTAHDCVDISASDPRRYPSTDILICSPECTNHSLSKGRKRKNLGQLRLNIFEPELDPSEERSRCTMWDVVRFTEYHQYNLIIVENVIEVRYWMLWDSWLNAMQVLGYDWQEVYFNSMFALPTPQSRDRIYVVFWKRGNRKPDLVLNPLAHCPDHGDVFSIQSWKNPYKSWGRYGRRNQYIYRCPYCAAIVEPYFTPAYTAIDWSLPSQRVGDRLQPLKPATLERIRKGLAKYCGSGWVEIAYGKGTSEHFRDVETPMPTQTARQTLALAQPFIITERFDGVHRSLGEALPTVMAGDGRVHHRLVQPFLTSYYGGSAQVSALDEVVPTVTTADRHALVQPSLEVNLEDCFFRMLQPCEIKRAMAFPESYQVLGNKRERVKQCGNAVTPPVMAIILKRCLKALEVWEN